MEKFLDYLWQYRSSQPLCIISGEEVVSRSEQLLDCDCFCPVTPQGGVLWHALGVFPTASTVASSPGAKEWRLLMIVWGEGRKRHCYVVWDLFTFYKIQQWHSSIIKLTSCVTCDQLFIITTTLERRMIVLHSAYRGLFSMVESTKLNYEVNFVFSSCNFTLRNK